MPRISLDANVLVYAVDSGDARRHRAARRIVATAATHDCVLTLQSLAEFYFVVTRKGKLSAKVAKSHTEELRKLFPLALPGARTLNAAIHLSEANRVGFWDGMLITVAREAGVEILLSEDLQDGQDFDGLRCFNPFGRTARELNRLLR